MKVIVADPNFAPMYATRTRKVKTDRRDATPDSLEEDRSADVRISSSRAGSLCPPPESPTG